MKKLLALVFSLWASLAHAGVPCTLPFNLQNNTVADATQVMANYNALVTCLGNAAVAGTNSDLTTLTGLGSISSAAPLSILASSTFSLTTSSTATLATNGATTWNTGQALVAVKTYDNVTNSGLAALAFTNADNVALTGTEHYAVWIGATSQGTGDGTPPATTFALGISAIKANWQTTTVAGEFGGINIAARCGHNNAVQSGDCSAITANVAVSQTNNFVTQFEGVSGYFPLGSTTNSLFINTQVGSIKASGLDTGSNTGIGFFAQARNGLVGNAFSASNLCASPTYGTCSKWLTFLNYNYDDGTHSPYNAFNVNQLGQVTIAGFGAVGTNQKTLVVGSSATNVFGIQNGARSIEILSLNDTGGFSVVSGVTSGSTLGTTGSLQLNGVTSGFAKLSGSATGGHLTYAGSGTVPTITAGCNGAGSGIGSGGTDLSATVTGSTAAATTCTLTFGTAFTVGPDCVLTGLSSPFTSITISTTQIVVTFANTPNYVWSYKCNGT